MLSEDFLNAVESQLLERRTLMVGKLTQDTSIEMIQRLLKLQLESDERITMLIHSRGGESFSSLALCDVMEHLITCPLRGVVVGRCDSAATFVLLHCTERLAMPNARFIIHSSRLNEVSLQVKGTCEEDLKNLQKQLFAVKNLGRDLYVRRLGISKKRAQKFIDRGDQNFDDTMSAKEAKKIGLIDGIVTGKLDTFLQQK